MKKYLFLLTVLFLLSNSAHAAKPSDFDLNEGNTISASDPGDPDVFIVNEHGYKRLFLNPVIFNFYGHLGGFPKIKKISSKTRDSFPTSSYYRNCETNDPKIYALKLTGQSTAELQWINTPGSQAVQDDPDFFKKVFCINNKEFNWYQKGPSIASANDAQIYDRAKRWGQALITICHHASDNPSDWHDISVADPSLIPGHLAHGDTLGSCTNSTPTPTPTPTSISKQPCLLVIKDPKITVSYKEHDYWNPWDDKNLLRTQITNACDRTVKYNSYVQNSGYLMDKSLDRLFVVGGLPASTIGPTGYSLAPSETVDYNIRIDPLQPGNYTGTLKNLIYFYGDFDNSYLLGTFDNSFWQKGIKNGDNSADIEIELIVY